MNTKLFIPFLLLFFCFNLNAQTIELHFNDVHIGRNMSMLYSTNGEKHQFYGGIKYHINKIVHDNQNNVFHNRFYASDFKEHIGLQFGYRRMFTINEKNSVFAFYDNQFTASGTRRHSYIPIAWVGDTTIYYLKRFEFQKMKAMEQNFGVGVQAELWKNIFLKFNIGGGVALYWDFPFEFAPNEFYVGNGKGWNFEFSGLLSVGVAYKIKRKKEKPPAQKE